MRTSGLTVMAALLSAIGGATMAEENPFDASPLEVRPRIFFRAEGDFKGLTIQKLRERVQTDEFAGVREKWKARPLGRAILWLLDGREEDRDAAIAALKKMDAREGTWSDRGLNLLQLAAMFDWLYRDLDGPTRVAVVVKIEQAADEAVRHVRGGQAPFFYSRTPGALAGLCVAGLALHGESPKAEGYLETFRKFGVDEYFQAYAWVDGAATGATYTMNYTYVDLPSICAAWWSATNRSPVPWIRARQRGWLDGIVRFYLWSMRPGFAFLDINDQFRGTWESHDEFCQGLDIASYLTRDGYGRAWSQRWHVRFGSALYHPEYGHNLIFRDPTLEAKPLTDLPLAELFGRESCGYGFFRSSWPKQSEPDTATHVFFRCGDPMDVHGGVAAGEFQIFKYAPLATRGGRYSSYDSPPDQYHRNCISTNVVLLTDPRKPDDRGDQNTRRGLKSDHAAWNQWHDIRRRNGLDVATITDWNVSSGEARCRADLTKAVPEAKCLHWTRELVWVANKYLLVLDLVQTPDPSIRRQWQLHLPSLPQVGERTIQATNLAPDKPWRDDRLRAKGEGRLFCQTLLPEQYTVVLQHGGKAESFAPSGQSCGPAEGNSYHLKYGRTVIQIDPGTESTRTVFLHVLTATESEEKQPPRASCRRIGANRLEVNVAGNAVKLEVSDGFVVP